jgi:hypothetical protein
MKSVRYLKVVLTVIAACLVWICLRNVVLVESATAHGGTTDVNIVELGGKRLSELIVTPGRPALPVHVQHTSP